MNEKTFPTLLQHLPPFLPTALTAALILFLSLHSFSEMPDNELFRLPHLDKIVHALMYFGLTAVLCFDTARHTAATGKTLRRRWPLWLLPLLFGGAMEIAQALFTTDRSGDILDFAANAVGVAAGYLLGTRLIGPCLQKQLAKPVPGHTPEQ